MISCRCDRSQHWETLMLKRCKEEVEEEEDETKKGRGRGRTI